MYTQHFWNTDQPKTQHSTTIYRHSKL